VLKRKEELKQTRTNAQTDLGYQPVVEHDAAWKATLDWFKENKDWWREKAANTMNNK
jgi:dTDP-D-glucose 4,6-dehydratase